MARRGGAATTAGIEYQHWYTARKVVDLILDQCDLVVPEAKLLQPEVVNSQRMELHQLENPVDDVFVRKGEQETYFNVKYQAPKGGNWTTRMLFAEGVIQSLIRQLHKKRVSKVVFVSQSACPLIKVGLPKLINLEPSADFKPYLNKEEFDAISYLQSDAGFTKAEIILLANNATFQQIPLEDFEENIKTLLYGRFSNVDSAPDVIFSFAVSKATKGEKIDKDKALTHLETKGIQPISTAGVQSILQQFKAANYGLLHVKSQITKGPQKLQIERGIAGDICDWFKNPIEEKSDKVAILIGDPGVGKSVVAKQVCERFVVEGVPVIGLKVDRLESITAKGLAEELDLSDRIPVLVGTVANQYPLVVVCIDQIDALSLCMAKNPRAKRFFIQLIHDLSRYENVRVLVTCREEDLRLDRDLDEGLRQTVKPKSFIIKKLSDQELEDALQRLGILKSNISLGLMELIKIPLYLDILVKIEQAKRDLIGIRTEQQLFEALLNLTFEKLNQNGQRIESYEHLLYRISKKMFTDRTLFVSRVSLTHGEQQLLKFFFSEGVLTDLNTKIQFFHQKFFDFIYAKSFLIDEASLSESLLKTSQGLFERSTVQMILWFLKTQNKVTYYKEIRVLLDGQGFRFHIRMLAVQSLAKMESPTGTELAIASQLILSNQDFLVVFLDTITSDKWLSIFNIETLLDDAKLDGSPLYQPLAFMLRKLHNRGCNQVLELIDGLELDNEETAEYVAWVMIGFHGTRNDLFIKVYEKIEASYSSFKRRFRDVLVDFARQRPDWFVKHLMKSVSDRIAEEPNRIDYISESEDDGLEKLFEHHRDLAVLSGFKLVTIIAKSWILSGEDHGESKKLRKSAAFIDFKYKGDQYERKYHHKLVRYIIDALVEQSKNGQEEVKEKVSALLQSDFQIEVLIGFAVIGKVPEYYNEIFAWVADTSSFFDLYFEGSKYVRYCIRRCLMSVFPSLHDEQKTSIANGLLSVNFYRRELSERTKPSTFKGLECELWHAGLDHHHLISSIGEIQIRSFPKLQRKYQEFVRKYGLKEDSEPIGIRVHVGSGLGVLPEIAYEKMDLRNWLNSFRKYQVERRRRDSDGFRISSDAHAGKFGHMVQKDPEHFYEFFVSLAGENLNPAYYDCGLRGFANSEIEGDRLRALLHLYGEESFTIKHYGIAEVINSLLERKALLIEDMRLIAKLILRDKSKTDKVTGADRHVIPIQTVAASILRYFLFANYNPSFSEIVFSTLNQILSEGSNHTKLHAFINLAWVNKYDQESGLQLFLEFVDDLDVELLVRCVNPLQHMIHVDFDALKPFFNRVKAVSEASEGIVSILIFAWIHKLPGAYNLLSEHLTANPASRKKALEVVFKNLNVSIAHAKCEQWILEAIPGAEIEEHESWDDALLRLDEQSFSDVKNILIALSASQLGPHIKEQIYGKLRPYARGYPEEVLEMIIAIENRRTGFDLKGRRYRSDSPLQLLIAVYYALLERSVEVGLEIKSLDLLDLFMRLPEHRNLLRSNELEGGLDDY